MVVQSGIANAQSMTNRRMTNGHRDSGISALTGHWSLFIGHSGRPDGAWKRVCGISEIGG